ILPVRPVVEQDTPPVNSHEPSLPCTYCAAKRNGPPNPPSQPRAQVLWVYLSNRPAPTCPNSRYLRRATSSVTRWSCMYRHSALNRVPMSCECAHYRAALEGVAAPRLFEPPRKSLWTSWCTER